MGLTPTQSDMSATNSGAPSQTVQPLPDPAEGDQDIRNFPSNGAIPDEIRGIIAPTGYHVP